MKKKILLFDQSLTVQKVVSLTLDKQGFEVTYAKSREEAMGAFAKEDLDLVLVSDQVPGIQWSSFPKEVELWLGRTVGIPPMVLITSDAKKEQRHYAALLVKPFTPLQLKETVMRHAKSDNDSAPVAPEFPEEARAVDDLEEAKMQQAFNATFSDEARLVNETFAEQGVASSIWTAPALPDATIEEGTADMGNELLGTEDSVAYKALLEKKVAQQIERQDLGTLVQRALNDILPPIVEKIVQERLDSILKEQEHSF